MLSRFDASSKEIVDSLLTDKFIPLYFHRILYQLSIFQTAYGYSVNKALHVCTRLSSHLNISHNCFPVKSSNGQR